MSQWFRLYESVLDDPKVQGLTPKQFKSWVNLLCLACKHNGLIPGPYEVSFALRTTFKDAQETLRHFEDTGLLDRLPDGDVTPHNWASRQYKSDGSAERMRRHRDRHRNVTSPVTVTPSESETEADTEQRVAKATQERAPAPADPEPSHAKPIKLPADWRPASTCRDYASDKGLDPDATAEAFSDYFTQGRGRNEKRDDAGWERRWRVWCNTDADRRPNGKSVRPAGPGSEAAAFARAAARLGGDEPVQ